jgi:hypothetical protein
MAARPAVRFRHSRGSTVVMHAKKRGFGEQLLDYMEGGCIYIASIQFAFGVVRVN